MIKSPTTPGKTQTFVLGRGFHNRYGRQCLTDRDGNSRIFFELTADPDHARYKPENAYEQMLRSMQPGATVRFLNVYWPDPDPRQAFLDQLDGWANPPGEIATDLLQSMQSFLQTAPLPYFSRVYLECMAAGKETVSWIESLVDLLKMHGITARELSAEEVQHLVRWTFNPELA